MFDAAAFLQSIRLDPDNDSLRMAFADWLDARGDPQGEFIRLQCQLARLPDFDSRASPLQQREQTLLSEYQQAWLGPLSEVDIQPKFRRGLLDSAALDAP